MFKPHNLILSSYSITDVGINRENNEDHCRGKDLSSGKVFTTNIFESVVLEDTIIQIIADGMGGCNAGEIASEFASHYIIQEMDENKDQIKGSSSIHFLMEGIMQKCHSKLTKRSHQDKSLEGMGTTLTAAIFKEDSLHISHVGDSRLYRFRDKQLKQLTEDQSPVGELQRSGYLSKEAARTHPDRHLIDQALGGGLPFINPQHKSVAIEHGDFILICTDGLTDSIPENQIQSILNGATPNNLKAISQSLVETALELDGSDNITLTLVYISG